MKLKDNSKVYGNDFVLKRPSFNPFLVQKFFGQNICGKNMKPVPNKDLIINLVFHAFIFTVYALNVLTMTNKRGEGYNFISRLRFWVDIYILPLLVIAVSGTLMIFRKDVIKHYHAIDEVLDDFDKMGIKMRMKFTEMYAMYILLFSTCVCTFVYDMIRSGAKYNVFFWVINYLPGLSVMMYVITILYFSVCCNQIFIALNNFLSKFCCDDLSSLEKLALCKKDVKPEVLLDLVDQGPYTYYEKVFILHDEACDIIRRINNISGYEFLVFIGCAAVTLLSLVYDTCLDMVMMSRGVPTMYRSFYATSYWPMVFACTLVNIVRLSAVLMGNANSTKYYLHKLRNIYPQLQDHVEVFSLQLVHQNMELSAARFFVLDRTVIYKLLGAFTTYIIILIQLETDSTED